MKKIMIYMIGVILLILITIFFIIFTRSLRQAVGPKSYCDEPVNCTKCENGTKECHYYIEKDDGNIEIGTDTIRCDCK